MSDLRRLAAVLAHPDDETLGFGGVLARYAAEGAQTALLTATRGQRGLEGATDLDIECEELGCVREAELRAAAQELGIKEVEVLDYVDGELDQAAPDEVIARIVAFLRRTRPQVVLTFDPFGVYGHPDHIAISQFTAAAIAAAASPQFRAPGEAHTHLVSKLYYRVDTPEYIAAYEGVFGELVMQVDGATRSSNGWPAWSITTSIDTHAYAERVWLAAACHASQVGNDPHTWERRRRDFPHLWDRYLLYRAFSLVNGGRQVEQDLFEGLRDS